MLRQEDAPIWVHLMGCPETDEYKAYQQLKWYQKIFKKNPIDYYLVHFKVSKAFNKP